MSKCQCFPLDEKTCFYTDGLGGRCACKCHKPTPEVVEEPTELKGELKRADDLIGHNVSGLESISLAKPQPPTPQPEDWEKETEKLYAEIKYQIMAWYLDEGEYQPTEEEAEIKSKNAIRKILSEQEEKYKGEMEKLIEDHGYDLKDLEAKYLK